MKSPSVYRMFDADGRLLYVGCTGTLPVRLDQHRFTQPWWADVASVAVEHFAKKHDALQCELLAIWKEAPAYNVPVGGNGVSRHREENERDRDCFQRWKDGETLEQVGASLGVSRERVRQIIAARHPAWEIGLVKQLHTTRVRLQRKARELADRIEDSYLCSVCGGLGFRRRGQRGGEWRTCSSECSRIYVALRFHVNLEERANQRRRVARQFIQSGRSVDYAHRVLNGEPVNSQGVWLTKNSKAWPSAITACARRYPIFDALPEDIQCRVRERIAA